MEDQTHAADVEKRTKRKEETKRKGRKKKKLTCEAALETRNSRLFSSLNSQTHLLLNQFTLNMLLTLLTICSDPNHEQKKGRQ